MPDSVIIDPQDPDWPLGLIVVVTPGTPVNIMSLVDPLDKYNSDVKIAAGVPRNTGVQCKQILIQAYKDGAGTDAYDKNTGKVYLMRAGASADDHSIVVAILSPGQTGVLDVTQKRQYKPHRYWVDADNAGDSMHIALLDVSLL